MAALTSTIIAGAGVALSAYQAYQGAQQQEDANKSAADIAAKQKMLAESNKVSGVQVPQLGYKLAQEANAQRSASQLQALQGAGVAGVLGGVPALNQAATAEDLQLAASLDAQKAERDQFVAAQEQASEARRVQQQSDMLNNQMLGAQNARAMGQMTEQAGYAGMLESAGTAIDEYKKNKPLYDESKKTKKLNKTATKSMADAATAGVLGGQLGGVDPGSFVLGGGGYNQYDVNNLLGRK